MFLLYDEQPVNISVTPRPIVGSAPPLLVQPARNNYNLAHQKDLHSIQTTNCKNATIIINDLLRSNDILCIEERWLFQNDLGL